MDDERLNRIEKKLNALLIILEGRYGSEGLASQVYKNRENIATLKAFMMKSIGALAVVVPVLTIILKKII